MSMVKMLEVIIEHDYYPDGICNNLHITTDTSTSEFINKNSFNVKNYANSWKIFNLDTNDVSLWTPEVFDENKINMSLRITSSDSNFYRSIVNSRLENEINCICNKNNETEINAISCSEKKCAKWKLKKSLVSKMDWNIYLEFKRDSFLKDEKVIKIKFLSKNVYWKYLLFTENDAGTMEIIDNDSIIHFENKGIEEFIDGRKVNTFISDCKMPLRDCDNHQFRLTTKKNGIVKNLIKRLPVASVSAIRYLNDSKDDFVSSIFIHT
jgi:hypothetical protein